MAVLNSAEIKRKAALGIPLSNPTPAAQAAYKAYQAAAKTNTNASTGSTAPKPTTTTTPASTTTNSSVSSRDARAAQKAAFTGWDNNPEVRALQEKHWSIYVDTGRNDTAEQKSLNEQAQKIRSYNNPMYDPTKNPFGGSDWVDAEKIYPRETTPNATGIEGAIDGVLNGQGASNMMTLGVGAVAIMVVFSMLRR